MSQKHYASQVRERTLGIADAVDVMHRYICFLDGAVNDGQSPLAMVLGGVSRQEAFPRRRDVGMPDIGNNSCRAIRVMAYDPCPELVRRSLET